MISQRINGSFSYVQASKKIRANTSAFVRASGKKTVGAVADAEKESAEKKTFIENESEITFPFVKIVGQDELKLCLIMNVIDPAIGGVLIMGDRGTAKSVSVRSLIQLLPEIDVVKGDVFNSSPTDAQLMGPDAREKYQRGEKLEVAKMRVPMVEVPLGTTEDRICGTIDIEKALSEGRKAYDPGLLAKANRGLLYIDEVNLLDDSLVDVVLDSAAGGWNTVEREGISLSHPAKFIMIGSGNPEEGELRPQLLDRFGMKVSVQTIYDIERRTDLVMNKLAFDQDPKAYEQECKEETDLLRQRIQKARDILPTVKISRDNQLKISSVCALVDVDGLRGDIVVTRAAKAYVAFEGRTEVMQEDIEKVIGPCLSHRLRKNVTDTMDGGFKVKLGFNKIFKGDAMDFTQDSKIMEKVKSAEAQSVATEKAAVPAAATAPAPAAAAKKVEEAPKKKAGAWDPSKMFGKGR
jgi:magnesium chelatase subunit I